MSRGQSLRRIDQGWPHGFRENPLGHHSPDALRSRREKKLLQGQSREPGKATDSKLNRILVPDLIPELIDQNTDRRRVCEFLARQGQRASRCIRNQIIRDV